MIQFVVGAAAGYVFGTKAGRRRYEQIKQGYHTAVNSPVAQSAIKATRKAIANKLDPQPRMKEIKDLRGRHNASASSEDVILAPDED